MSYNDIKLKIICSFKITKLAGKCDKQQVKMISMTQASETLMGIVLFLKLGGSTQLFIIIF